MESFPSNSHGARRPQEEPKRVEQIVTSGVQRRKTPLSRRMTQNFIGGDVTSTRQYILTDIIVPTIRDLLFNVIKDGAERMIFQDSTPRPRGRGLASPFNYAGQMSSRGPGQPPNRSRSSRSAYSLDDLVFETRMEAAEVLNRLEFYLDQYGMVSVADLYGLVGFVSTHIDTNWGWTDLSNAQIRHMKEGYLLQLPRSESLK